jgi:hypothetical protein
MAAPWRSAADLLAADLQRIFGDRLRAIVAYGPRVDGSSDAPLTCLVTTTSLGVEDLEACAARMPAWSRAGLATPLLVRDDEFVRSLDAFPLEYGEILRTHADVFGENPFAGVAIAHDDLRRACETQAKSHLVHLREAFLECGGRPQAVAEMVTASAPAFAALLRNVAKLAGVNSRDRVEAAHEGARAAGLQADGIVADVLALERPSGVSSTDAARLFPGYLTAVERLADAVDAWPT